MADANLYRFSSKEFHANSSLYYYGFRFYDPNLQRWINRDPIGERGEINLYRVVGNKPTTRNDHWGLIDFFCVVEGEVALPVGIPIGFDFSIGAVLDCNNFWNTGIFRSVGPAVGANLGCGGGFGASRRSVYGSSSNWDLNMARFSPSFCFDDDGFNSFMFTWGPGKGVSYSNTFTEPIFTLDDLRKWIGDAVDTLEEYWESMWYRWPRPPL
jgi:RHS repeat-associated protein